MSGAQPTAADIGKALRGRPSATGGWSACCPAHNDATPSLSIRDGDCGRVLVHCHSPECSQAAVITALKHRGLWADAPKPDGASKASGSHKPAPKTLGTPTAHWFYEDSDGKQIVRVTRFEVAGDVDPETGKQRKTFRQFTPDGRGGWKPGLSGLKPPLYRLPELHAAPAGSVVYVVEGEAKAELLRGWGLTATTCIMGAEKFRGEHAEELVDRDIVILPDNDDAGRKHRALIAALLKGKARTVKVLKLPGLPHKGDVIDWQRAGGNADELARLIAAIGSNGKDHHEEAAGPSTADKHYSSTGTYANGHDDTPLVLSPGAPMVSARAFIGLHHIEAGLRTLHHQNDTFYTWRKTHYAETSKEEIRGRLYAFLDKARRPAGKDATAPFDPTRPKVANVLEATAAVAQITQDIRPPTWLDAEPHPAAADLIGCANGLFDITTRKLLPHTPAFFSVNSLAFPYQPTAPEPRKWLGFLAQLWPKDQAAISCLQEMFGLFLTGDTRHQKALLIVGPKRSGKGTIARVLMKLLGQDNVCGPTLSSLSTNFGLAPLIGKRLAVISDARLGTKADQSVVVERILAITGEDTLSVDRKHRDVWTGRFEVRFCVLTNEMPRLTDSSGALASRFIILTLTQSFLGKEDLALADRLGEEMPGILNWSLAGLKRLRDRGHFVPPASSDAARQELEDLGSPIGAFLRDRCDVAGNPEWDKTPTGHLFEAWCTWCRDNNHDRPGTTQMFGRDLRSALPNLNISRPRKPDGSDGRVRYYDGITLKSGF